MIDAIAPYIVSGASTITATAAVGAWRTLSEMAQTVEENEQRSITNQRRQIGEPDEPETLDEPILDRVRSLERGET